MAMLWWWHALERNFHNFLCLRNISNCWLRLFDAKPKKLIQRTTQTAKQKKILKPNIIMFSKTGTFRPFGFLPKKSVCDVWTESLFVITTWKWKKKFRVWAKRQRTFSKRWKKIRNFFLKMKEIKKYVGNHIKITEIAFAMKDQMKMSLFAKYWGAIT